MGTTSTVITARPVVVGEHLPGHEVAAVDAPCRRPCSAGRRRPRGRARRRRVRDDRARTARRCSRTPARRAPPPPDVLHGQAVGADRSGPRRASSWSSQAMVCGSVRHAGQRAREHRQNGRLTDRSVDEDRRLGTAAGRSSSAACCLRARLRRLPSCIAATRAIGMVCPSATRSAGSACGSGSSAAHSVGGTGPPPTSR